MPVFILRHDHQPDYLDLLPQRYGFPPGPGSGQKYIYSGAVAGVDVKYLQCICIKDKAVYIFTYTASPEQYDQYTDDIDRMLETFTFK